MNIASLLTAAAVVAGIVIEIPIESTLPQNASDITDNLGNNSNPNEFTANLIANLAEETGLDPILRICGATGDRVSYVATQEDAMIQFWDNSYNLDQPKNMTIGPRFWESFNVLETGKYTLQLNSYKNDSNYQYNINAMVNETLRRISNGRFHLFEQGNENDVAVGNSFRPAGWGIGNYVVEWKSRTRGANSEHDNELRYMAPSFATFNSDFSVYSIFNETLDINEDGWIAEISQHLYVTGAQNKISLQGTLMNHTQVMRTGINILNLNKFHRSAGRYFIIGESNSIYGQGALSISDVFGSALWSIDFALYFASQSVRRIHYHQGTSFRYASWLPIAVNETKPFVKPPYYGNVFAARFIGPSGKTQINHHLLGDPLHPDEHNVAYAAYDDGKLARVALLNILEFNGTQSGEDERPFTTFSFPAPTGVSIARVARLWAPQAHENTTIIFDGYTYSYEQGKGKPLMVSDDEELVHAQDGVFSVDVEASGAAIITVLQ
ncbi:family 79 glycoside hydrolase [Xylariaceae sp. FL1651]|nr:family 79 glycoside hydrolase [Xylariaceae sp. FL1651]